MQKEMDFDKYIQRTGYLKFFKSKSPGSQYNLENLRQNYTIYTFSVLNITGQVDYFEFTDELKSLDINKTLENLSELFL